MTPTRVAWLERAALAGFASALVLALTVFRFEPFSLRGDGPVYYLPVISTTTNALLSGTFPRVLWQLGAGWTPFEAGQIGLGYPPYLLVGAICRLVQRPLAFLDVSSALHLALAGLLVRELSPPSVDSRTRFLAAALAIVQPAPVVLGMPWHAYLSAYPWGLALALLLWLRDLDSPRVRILIPVTSTLLFWVGHPHTFLWTWLLVGLGTLALRRPTLGQIANRWPIFLTTALPVVVPILWLSHAAQTANAAFIQERWQPGYLMSRAQSLVDVLPALFVGNLSGWPELRLWGRDGAGGAGIFFCPLLLVAVVDAARRRRFGVLFMAAFVLLVLAPAGFDFMALLARGPLAGTRWTWKFSTVILPPIAVAVALGARPEAAGEARFATSRVRSWATLGTLVVGLGVIWRGASFDLATVWWDEREVGLKGMYAEAARFAATLHAPARVALVGKHHSLSTGIPVPLAYLGLVGNAPLLVPGLETAHLHEPLESEAAARHHFRLGTPWRITVPRTLFPEHPERAKADLESIGVTAVVALDPAFLPRDAATHAFVSRDGRTLWVRELAPSPPYPLRGAGRRLSDGSLLVPAPANIRPTRPLELERVGDAFRARPPLPWTTIALGALAVLAAVGVLAYSVRPGARTSD